MIMKFTKSIGSIRFVVEIRIYPWNLSGFFCSTIISASGIDICVEIMLVIIIRVKKFSEIISIIISEKIF